MTSAPSRLESASRETCGTLCSQLCSFSHQKRELLPRAAQRSPSLCTTVSPGSSLALASGPGRREGALTALGASGRKRIPRINAGPLAFVATLRWVLMRVSF